MAGIEIAMDTFPDSAPDLGRRHDLNAGKLSEVRDFFRSTMEDAGAAHDGVLAGGRLYRNSFWFH
jgi:hypothetical protein